MQFWKKLADFHKKVFSLIHFSFYSSFFDVMFFDQGTQKYCLQTIYEFTKQNFCRFIFILLIMKHNFIYLIAPKRHRSIYLKKARWLPHSWLYYWKPLQNDCFTSYWHDGQCGFWENSLVLTKLIFENFLEHYFRENFLNWKFSQCEIPNGALGCSWERF